MNVTISQPKIKEFLAFEVPNQLDAVRTGASLVIF